jgi:hypothetical protein
MKPLAFAHAAVLALSLAGAAHAGAGLDDAGAALLDSAVCPLDGGDHACAGAPWGTPDSAYGAMLTGLQNQKYFENTLNLPAAGVYAPGALRLAGRNGGAPAAYVDNNLPSPVPEPSSYSLLLIGLILLAFTARGNDTEKFDTVAVKPPG